MVIGNLFQILVTDGINEVLEDLRRVCGVRNSVWLRRLYGVRLATGVCRRLVR